MPVADLKAAPKGAALDLEPISVAMDEAFQAACQRYARGNGSSEAIASAALRAIARLLAEAAASQQR